jgi:acyl-CoA synthetase (NDP forming)
MDYFSTIPEVLLEEKNADVLLYYFSMPNRTLERMLKYMGVPTDQIAELAPELFDAQCDAIINLLEKRQKPFAGYTYQDIYDKLVRRLVERGIPIYQGPQRAVRAIEAAFQYTRLREKISASVSPK